MIYNQFKDKSLSLLGFGTMRLPQTSDGKIDKPQTEKMIDLAIKNGVNYFDTAWPYHGGESEVVVGEILKKYPRDSYYLADKYPGHQISKSYDPKKIFEAQLKKCGVDYFDFYLLHNVYENSIGVYLDSKWGIIDYFKEQKRLGRIKHLGFSSHGRVENLKEFLDVCGDDMEFCQIQLNYLDWSLQNAKEKYELLTERNIPVWVMEPVRGGKLAHLSDENEARLKELRPDESIAAWSFRFLQGLDNVKMVLSGMSDMDQTVDNLKTFESSNPLSENETELILNIAEGLKSSVPCTGCRYCTDGCPIGLDIPLLISVYNEISYAPTTNSTMILDTLSSDKRPEACIACGACSQICPQGINVPDCLSKLSKALEKIPSWAEICRQREAIANKMEGQ